MHPLTRRRQLIVATVLSALLFLMLVVFRTNEFFIRLDHFASALLTSVRSDSVTSMLVVLTEIFSIPFMAIFVLGMAVVLLWSDKRLALRLTITAALGAFLFSVIKVIIHSPRPFGGLIDVAGFSFPSGHATMAAILFVFLAQLFERVTLSRIFHLLFNLLALCMIVSVSLSRIYLGVHWLSDVLAGMLLGVFSTGFVALMFERRKLE